MGSYRIEARYFDGNGPKNGMLYVLCPSPGKSFIEDLYAKDMERLSRILNTARRIYSAGCRYGFDSQTIKPIVSGGHDIAIFEVRVKGTVIRVASYIHEGWIPIYLFDFDSHQGSKSKLPKRHIKRAAELACEARACAREFDFSEYNGKK